MTAGPSAAARRRRPCAGSAGERGASAVELAVVAPALLALIFFIIQSALWFHGRNVALQAAREGVSQLRLAVARPGAADPAAVEETVERQTAAFAATVGGNSLLRPRVTAEFRKDDGRVTVAVEGEAVSLVGLTLPVRQRVTGEIERFEGDTQ